jgi:hypothetical protein
MRKLPVVNDKLDIQISGLHRWSEGLLGIVVTPGCMNIVLLPSQERPSRMDCSKRVAIVKRGDPCPECDGYGMIVKQGDELRPK